MRLSFTVIDPGTDQRLDAVVDCAGETTVDAVADELSELLGGAVDPARPRTLFVSGQPLEGSSRVARSALRDGILVSLDDPAGCARPRRSGIVELRVVGGPGAGEVHPLDLGDHEVGSDATVAVRLDDPQVLGRALRVEVARDGSVQIETYDAVAARLDGDVLAARVTWEPGRLLAVGGTLLALAAPEPAGSADAATRPSADGAGLDVNRPPRWLPPMGRTRFRLPAAPREPDRRPLPIVMAVLPVLLAAAMVLVFRRWYFAVVGLFAPLTLLGSHLHDRRSGRRSHRRRLAEHRQERAAIEADVARAVLADRAARRAGCPDPAAVLQIAIGPGRRIWERRRHDADALTLRVGTADLPSAVLVDDLDLPEGRRERARTVGDVPVPVLLRDCGVLGVAGRGDFPRGLARWLVAQAATLHSPSDLALWVLTDGEGLAGWQWLRWLPHSRPSAGQDAAVLIGHDPDSARRRLAELMRVVADRKRPGRDGQPSDLPDIIVVLDGAHRMRTDNGVVQLLRDGPSVGVFAVCLDSDERLLPEECRAVVAQDAVGAVVRHRAALAVMDVRPDLVSSAWCERLARALAPLRDTGGALPGAGLPAESRLLDLLDLEPPTAARITARWACGGHTTAAVVGVCRDGPFEIDLCRDGPHVLVAGTTGAGKSELLQTMVASLAAANRPDALTFVLVDYKGGAAFGQCAQLPHTLGVVTDLDGHLAGRALQSLGAELRRREEQLAAVGAKDIEQYVAARRGDPSIPVMARLVIVIDEFASLARELPDFVTGLVNVAQRGRSLGLHLVLATQRPGGVVSSDIRANTNLRLALRVTDAGESSDVIDAPDAAQISRATPGRGYARLGHSSLVAFQAARVAGRRPGARPPVARRPWVAALDAGTLGVAAPVPPVPAVEDEEVTDLQVLVESLRAAVSAAGVAAPPSPWLPALTEHLVLDDLVAALPPADLRAAGALPAAPFALEDVPARQSRRVATFDLARDAHLYIVGAPRSGRSQVLRTVAGSLASACSPADVHLYGLDCGNGALRALAGLPHCGAVVPRDQAERAARLIRRLTVELAHRHDVLADGGFADLTEQRTAVAAEHRLPHLVLLVDRWEGFVTTLGDHDGGELTEAIHLLLREGASAGVHVIVTGDRSLISSRMATFTDNVLVLRLTDRADFGLAGIDPRSVPQTLPGGRGVRAASGLETQVALLGPDPSAAGQAAVLAEISRRAGRRETGASPFRQPFRVDPLPERLTFPDAWRLRDDIRDRPLWGLVGVGGDELSALGVEMRDGARTFAVGGPPRSGRSTVLLTMARSFLAGGGSVVLVTPARSPLTALRDRSGVLGVLDGRDVAADGLGPVVSRATGPFVVLIDDAELLRDASVSDELRDLTRPGQSRGVGLVVAGRTEDLCAGVSGWLAELRRGRRGALLAPASSADGELIGVRVPRSMVGAGATTAHRGRAVLHLGDGCLHTVQVPLTAPVDQPACPPARREGHVA